MVRRIPHRAGLASPRLAPRPLSPVAVQAEAAGADFPNVEGRSVAGPTRGFGQLWRKRFEVALDSAIPPDAVLDQWQRYFSDFWPGSSELITDRLEEGRIAGADLEMPAGTRITTGLIVVLSDEQGFTLMTLQGHMFAGWVRFSTDMRDGATVASIEIEMRAGDPIYELGLVMGGHKKEEQFWCDTLFSLSRHFGQRKPVRVTSELVDPHRQWTRIGNAWYNAAIRTQIFRLGAPLRALFRRERRV